MDDEDITFLRLTALKSLNAKKEADLLVQTSKAVAATQRHSRSRSKSPNIVHHNYLPSQEAPSRRRQEYSPWSDPSPPHNFAYFPTQIHAIPNVQLSPRSAAFVYKNNDILARRIEGSPSPPHPPHSYRPQSPMVYGQNPYTNDRRREDASPMRAHSRSPGQINSHLRNRSPPHFSMQTNRSPVGQHSFRRATNNNGSSRSPPPQSSHIRHYTLARTPPTTGRSPNNRPSHQHQLSPRYRSRSPKTTKTLLLDIPGKSGHHTSPNARGRSPSGYAQRTPDLPPSNPHNHSPSHQQRPRNAAPPSYHSKHSERSANPSTNSQQSNTQNRRRTRSPLQNNSAKVSRSHSQSPPARKHNSSQRNQNAHRREDRSRNDRNPRHRGAHLNNRRKKRSRSPIIKEIPTLTTVNIVSETAPVETVDRPEAKSSPPEASRNTTSTMKSEEKPGTDTKPNESASSSEDEDEHADEIDLFASSEESESSENEGRFKSAKPERNPQLPAVSFSALVSGSMSGTNATAIESNLDEISNSMGIPSANSDRNNQRIQRHRRDRHERGDRGQRYETGDSWNRNRGGGDRQHINRGSGRGDSGSEDRRRRDGVRRSGDERGGSRRRSPMTEKGLDGVKEEQVVESSRADSATKYDVAKSCHRASSQQSSASTRHTSRNRSEDVKRNEESSSSSSLKSTVSSAVSTVSKSAISSSVRSTAGPSTAARESTHSAAAAPADLPEDSSTSSSKKAIHLRLGAMTQTWKTSKKQPRSNASPEKV